MNSVTGRLIEVQPGLRLWVEAAPPSADPVLILSNSIGSDYGMWDEVVARLSGQVRIIRYDTRGHGRSELGTEALTIEHLGRDVIGIMDALEISRAVFCGLSLGGLTGQWLGAEAPERFDGLILANTAPSFPPPDLWLERARTVRDSGMKELVGPTVDRWLTEGFRVRQPDRAAGIRRMIASTPAEGYARCCEVLAITDLAYALPRVRVPVRVICGQHDPSATPARGAEIVASVPDADILTLDAAHISAIEAADAFAQAALEFTKRVTSAKQREKRDVERKTD
ncbi:3-oxoadipate enol-lactonase [Bradyrhizobium sp. RDT10]